MAKKNKLTAEAESGPAVSYDFLTMVARMRNAQVAYFKYRDSESLKLSINYEKQVDKALQTISEEYAIKPGNTLTVEKQTLNIFSKL